ncbi:hypothetical protein [Nonomuraea sp. SYSU D8015]|nr:hypothetical protein [Nonomuraea sp. SYSU D8015]
MRPLLLIAIANLGVLALLVAGTLTRTWLGPVMPPWPPWPP